MPADAKDITVVSPLVHLITNYEAFLQTCEKALQIDYKNFMPSATDNKGNPIEVTQDIVNSNDFHLCAVAYASLFSHKAYNSIEDT